jgi:hypothetical protein
MENERDEKDLISTIASKKRISQNIILDIWYIILFFTDIVCSSKWQFIIEDKEFIC